MAIYWLIPSESEDGSFDLSNTTREEQRCHYCGGEAFPQRCPGDGGMHGHGTCHHTYPDVNGYVATCNECYPKIELAWEVSAKINRLLRE